MSLGHLAAVSFNPLSTSLPTLLGPTLTLHINLTAKVGAHPTSVPLFSPRVKLGDSKMRTQFGKGKMVELQWVRWGKETGAQS